MDSLCAGLTAKGWPTFERAISGQIKRASRESWRRIVDTSVSRSAGGTYRAAPEHPRAFAARLARTVFTNGKADCEVVARLYADTLAGALGSAAMLEFRDCQWTDADAEGSTSALADDTVGGSGPMRGRGRSARHCPATHM